MPSLARRLVLLALVAGLVLAAVGLMWPAWSAAVTEASVAEEPAAQGPPGGLPPTIRPASPANPAQIATIPPRPTAPGGNPPGAPAAATPAAPPGARPGAPPTLPPSQPQAAPPGATVGPGGGQPAAGAPTVGAAPGGQQPGGPMPPPGTVGAGPATATPSAGAVPLRSLSGVVVGKTEQSVEIQIGDRGAITVEPRPQTEIRRDGVRTTLDAIEIGDNATVSINEENFPLAIIASSPPEASGTNPLWYVLLGVVMLGVTLMLDSDLRRKFMAALLEP
ncbi:MAG: hypothetical protein U0768_01315 [Anaerolineae bacterium]